MLYFVLLSFFAGIAIALQANMNSQLGVLLTSSLLATFIALLSSAIFTSIAMAFLVKDFPSINVLKSVPIYLYFCGGLLSAFALASFYYVIPKIGILSMISFGLTGQLIYSVVSSHFGLFDLPVSSINISKILGVIAMLIGIFLINKG